MKLFQENQIDTNSAPEQNEDNGITFFSVLSKHIWEAICVYEAETLSEMLSEVHNAHDADISFIVALMRSPR